jgi:hypothetical protein
MFRAHATQEDQEKGIPVKEQEIIWCRTKAWGQGAGISISTGHFWSVEERALRNGGQGGGSNDAK